MSRWWRAYDEALNDPKVQRLPPHLFKTWFNLLCVASKYDGVLPPIHELAYLLRRRAEDVSRDVAALCARCLFDATERGVQPHNWDTRQYKSDLSTQRVSKHRKRFGNVSGNVSETANETPPETETETETEQNRGRETRLNGYAFAGKVVRLRKKNFDDWVKAFPRLDLLGELTARDAWLSSPRATEADRKNWFASTSQHFANRNMEAGAKQVAMRPDGQPRRGVEGII
jgi:hypothetical protein